MYEIYSILLLLGILAVSIAHFAVFFYDFYTASKIQEAFTPETIQDMIQGQVADQELSEMRAEAGAQGGVNRSAAIRMKEFDSIVGQGMLSGLDPTVKSAISMIFPDAENWIERNPDLAGKAMQRLQPYLQEFLNMQGDNSSQPRKSGGWK